MSEQKSELRIQIEEATQAIRNHTKHSPEIGIILGTGLGGLAEEIEKEVVIDYSEIPHFALSTVEHHKGKLIFGKISGKQIVAMQGRFHFYEGYTMKQITFPVRVMNELGAKTLLISNACGSMNPNIKKGSIMLMEDHINLQGDNPLIGPNDNTMGLRFPDMSQPYSHELIKKIEEIALDNKIQVQKGVYVAVPGPNLETRAEYRFLRAIGADVVGMSSVPENIVARHINMNVAGFSVITDECYPDALVPATFEDIIAAAALAEPKLILLMKELIKKL